MSSDGASVPRPSHDLLAHALEELRAGRPVLVADSTDRENEVDVVLAAELATPEWVGWTVRHTSGYLCAPMPPEVADRLDLPLMVPRTQDSLRTAYTISVDAARGVTTGISAADRARTLHALADPASGPSDLIRPGHLLPLRALPGGVSQRPGHTEAAVELCRAAGLSPVAMIAELVHDAGEVMRLADAQPLAREHGLVVITIEQLLEALPSVEVPTTVAQRVTHTGSAQLPTRHGAFTVHGYRDHATGAEHLAVVSTTPPDPDAPVTVRVHSECLTGEALGSERCECGPQLDAALELIAEHGGAVVYLRGHEGRGIGLLEKLAAYDLQDRGRDTVTANLELGWAPDLREYGAAAAILHDLGLTRIDLLTNNPDKGAALAEHGITVEHSTPLLVGRTAANTPYLRTKADAMGHLIPSDYLNDRNPS
ncbi:bifunctional 3,4-dihydroxy-2-butanone-4-phosphate synthase/GTP cyclohydrolase II [Aestuariimicrobium kwangyangense]|uniref:bifunctional 3,4-dihydroxy-2-butanone-4-phosphate synthase/GTP cyclohydrolase II n=1 Tax=Aestuariimicrobium kwangyangense TaxID=396389 RepID=UPI0003B5AC17|nr:bifunctional 3,4-dihydroxy-2-butanone-4-phosphate synthase/GTP cyclohydrolase II [Aestuariimicrobium kwangyangense]